MRFSSPAHAQCRVSTACATEQRCGVPKMRLRAKMIAHPVVAIMIFLAFVGVAAGAVPAFRASERASFCTSCHEMGPYYDAWAKGPHRLVECVECHVDAGALNHVSHKATAAKELWIHLTGDPRFPKGTAAVPDARCLTCHASIPRSSGPRFSHKAHAKTGPCLTCHLDVGHRVPLAALVAAGVLKSGVETSRTPAAASAATTATLHTVVPCTRCHDLNAIACATCHKPAHKDRGECATCHRPGPRWVFSHPASADCASCHAAPQKHFGASCASCHSPSVPFARTVYTHTSDACGDCHAAPARHNTAAACAACHRKPGVSWAFSHPDTSACGSCHAAPAKHFGGACASCHHLGVAFAKALYRHTSSGCASCHSSPAGHNRAVSCASCHKRPGVSWAASHPSSTSCASCHRAPSSHYGTSCASCHKASVAWSSATFRHPSTGPKHTYRSFACVKCHPNGYASHTCVACHDSGAGGSDD